MLTSLIPSCYTWKILPVLICHVPFFSSNPSLKLLSSIIPSFLSFLFNNPQNLLLLDHNLVFCLVYIWLILSKLCKLFWSSSIVYGSCGFGNYIFKWVMFQDRAFGWAVLKKPQFCYAEAVETASLNKEDPFKQLVPRVITQHYCSDPAIWCTLTEYDTCTEPCWL